MPPNILSVPSYLQYPNSMEKQGIKRWEEMQLDCLIIIFSKLSVDDLTASVPFVCKSWSQASIDPNCWRVLDFRGLDLKPGNFLAQRFTAQYSLSRFTFSGFLKFSLARSRRAAFELRFSSVFSASMEVLSLASKECPRLQALALPRINLDDEELFLNLIASWKDLEWLEMESKPSKLAEIAKQINLHCNNFHGLKLRGSIKREEALVIVNSLPKLRFLDLSSSQLAKEELLVIVDGCRQLKGLSVKDCVGFDADDEEVKRRVSGFELFENEGCKIEGESGYQNDECDALENMYMYYDDFFLMWMF